MYAIGDMSVAHVAHQNTIRVNEWDLNSRPLSSKDRTCTASYCEQLGERLMSMKNEMFGFLF